jgi:hypothetical protein
LKSGKRNCKTKKGKAALLEDKMMMETGLGAVPEKNLKKSEFFLEKGL